MNKRNVEARPEITTLAEADNYAANPRILSTTMEEVLRAKLDQLGDLGGIVRNVLTNEIIGGNQRKRVFDGDGTKVTITERLKKPDRQGTVAHGYVEWKGARYAYREVSWDEKTAAEANIVANKVTADWDEVLLRGNFSADLLLDAGFTQPELRDLGFVMPDVSRPEFENDDATVADSTPDANYFYIEYYGQTERFVAMKSLIVEHIVGAHGINPEFFDRLLQFYFEHNPKTQTNGQESI